MVKARRVEERIMRIRHAVKTSSFETACEAKTHDQPCCSAFDRRPPVTGRLLQISSPSRASTQGKDTNKTPKGQ